MPDLIPISAVTDAANRAATVQPTNELDKDAFLQLLVAQLKYQNPLSPSDPNQFMAQTAQFTMVEKLEEMAANSAAQRAIGESITASGLLGKEVSWIGDDGEEVTGVVTGARFGTAGTVLQIGEERVPLTSITGIGSTPSNETTDTTDSTTEATDGTDTATDTTPDTTSTESAPTDTTGQEA